MKKERTDMAEGMTKVQLKEFIDAHVAPMIKDLVGKDVAEIVKASVAEAMKANKPAGPGAQIFAGEHEAPGKRAPGITMARGLRAVAAAKLQGGGLNQAIEILKVLQAEKKIRCDSVPKFIELVEKISAIL